MDEQKNGVYAEFSEAQRKLVTLTKKTVKDYFPYVMLVADILFTVMTRLFTAGFQNVFTPSYFIALISNVMAVMFCYTTFVPYGHRREKIDMPEYGSTYRAWMELSRRVRSGLSEAFTAYCRRVAEEEREDARRMLIENKTMIPWAVYVERYRDMKPSKLASLAKTGELTKAEAAVIRKANSRVKLREVNPVHALSGVRATRATDAIRADCNRNILAILFKPVSMVLISIVTTAFVGTWVGVSDLSVIYSMVYSAILIIIASVTGYSKGAANAHADLDMIKIRLLFLETFFEKNAAEGKNV